MSSEAIWLSVCPICEGKGKIDIVTTVSKNGHRKNASEGFTKECEICLGKGNILVCKKIRKSK